MQRNIWVLGYFGGGPVPISNAMDFAKEYAFANTVPIENVVIDEIFKSRRYKGFKFIYSTDKQEAEKDAERMDDVFKWLMS